MRQIWNKNTRYYSAQVERDLFGWVVTRAWGRRGTALGQIRTDPVESLEIGLQRLEEIGKTRKSHGYERVQ